MTPDRLGYNDSANLYAFAGGDPVNNSDPTGLACLGLGGTVTCSDLWSGWKSLGSSAKEIKKTLARTGASLAGVAVGAVKTVADAAAAPITMAGTAIIENVTRAQMTVDAYKQNGAKGVLDFATRESKDIQAESGEKLANALPFVGTARSFSRALREYENGNNFGGGMGMAETTVLAMGDASLVYGGVQRLRAGRSMYHYTSESGEAGIRRTGRILPSEPERLFSVNEKGISDAGMGDRSFSRNVFFTDVPPSQMTPQLRSDLGIYNANRVVTIGENQIRSQVPFFANQQPNIFNAVGPYVKMPTSLGVYFGIYGLSRGQALTHQ